MEERLKVVGTPYRHCFAILPASLRDKIISQSTSTSLSGSIVLKLKWLSPISKISFIGCRGDKTCEEGYIHIPMNVLQCIHLPEKLLVSVTFVSSTTSYATTQLYDSISLKPSSYEDWEIIQYNSDYVRDHLLEQIDVINDKDEFPIYIGDIKVHLQLNMKLRWGFVKLGRDTTIDIMPLKRSAKKTVQNKNIDIDDNASEITHHTHSSSPSNYVQHPSFYETKEAEIKEEIKADVLSSIADADEEDLPQEEICSIFRIGSYQRYVNDIASIPPNVIVVSPLVLRDDDEDEDDDDDIDAYDKSMQFKAQSNQIASVWDEFCEGQHVIVTFCTRSKFVTVDNDHNGNEEEEKVNDDAVYKSVLMTMITCDYIENDEMCLFSEYDMNCYDILVGDHCVIEPMKVNENCKHLSIVSPINDSQYITIHMQQVQIVSSNIITSCSDLVLNEWKENTMLYLDDAFKTKLMQYIQDSNIMYISNHSIIIYHDKANANAPPQYFYMWLSANSSQLQTQIDDEEIMGLISIQDVAETHVAVEAESKCFWNINYDLLPPLNDELIQKISQDIMKQFAEHRVYPSHTMIYGNDIRLRLQYISRIINTIHTSCDNPIAVIHVNCALYTNARIRDIYQLLDDVIAEAKELSPSMLIFHDLDSLISYQKEANVASMKAFQIGQKVWKHIQDLNHYSATNIKQGGVLTVASVVDPSSLDINFLSMDIFHTIFCLNASENGHTSKSKQVSTRSKNSQHLQHNLEYLYSHLKPMLAYESLKTLVLNHCNKWFKYASYHDIKLFVDQCLIEFAARHSHSPSNIESLPFNDIIIKISHNFIPPTMRETFQSSSNTEDNEEESWHDIGGLSTVKQELLDIFETPSKYPAIFDQLPLKLRSGVLLYGPPGCGKTMIAKCVARRCGINLISVKGPELLNKYIGASEAAVRDVFMRAKQSSPCIIFFDEFESLAPKRGSESTGVTDRVVNQLLTFLDGVESRSNVYVLAASSRPDLIDVALLRPGRLDKKLLCDKPDIKDRKDIIERIINNKKINIEDIDEYKQDIIEWIAKESEHFSGADLNMIFSIAQTAAFHRCKKKFMHSIEVEIKNEDDEMDDFQHKYDDLEVCIAREDLNDAIKETKVNVTASLHQQRQQGLTGLFKSKPDVGSKSIQY